MPFPELHIEDENQGLPRQPVPLRYACLVTRLGFRGFLYLLAVRQENRYEYLTGYEFGTQGEVSREFYSDIYKKVPRDGELIDLLKLFPPDHYVWSDELAEAFGAFVRDHAGYEDAAAEGMGLCWKPALHGMDVLIEGCVDLSSLVEGITGSEGSEPAYLFRRSPAGGWDIRFAGHACGPFKDSLGLQYLRHFLQNPTNSLSAIELSALVQQPVLADEQQEKAEKAAALFESNDTNGERATDSLSLTMGGDAGQFIDGAALDRAGAG